MRSFKIYFLSNFQICNFFCDTNLLTTVTILYITSHDLFYKWKSIAFDFLHPFNPSPTHICFFFNWNIVDVKLCKLQVSDQIRSDESLSRVWFFVTPWITARQASLSINNSWSSPRLTSIESVMPSSWLGLSNIWNILIY